MKNQIFNLIKVTALAAILAAGVSAVSAFTGPSTLPPPGGPASPVSIPVNVSSDAQKKIGGFISELFLKSGVANAFTLTGANAKGWIIAEDTLVSPWSFSIKTFLPGTESQMKIGSNSSDLTQFTDATFPLTIDLAGRGTAPSPKGRDAIELLANTNYCNTQTTIRTNTPGVQFWSRKNDNNADLIARQVQLNGGNPAKDKVLISVDSDGNATWAKVNVTNGVISYTDYTTSPAAEGQVLCGTPPIIDPSNTPQAYACSAQATGESIYDDDRGVWVAPGTGTWVKDSSITCTSMLIPKLPNSGQNWFIDGDVVCTITPPDNSSCKPTGTFNTSKSTCHVGDSYCGSNL